MDAGINRIFDLKICAEKSELSDGSDVSNLVSDALSFGHKQRGQCCHRIDVQYFVRHEVLSNGGIGVLQYAVTAERATRWLPVTA